MQGVLTQPMSDLLSSWSVDLGSYIEHLLTEKQQLVNHKQHTEILAEKTVQDLCDPLTNLNLRVYLLENSAPDQTGKHVASLKETIIHLNHVLEDLRVQARQSHVSADDFPAGNGTGNGFIGTN
jgi:hypothetical protein